MKEKEKKGREKQKDRKNEKKEKLIRVNKNKLHVKARRQITNINLRAHTWYV